jgi:hypothetical protein
MIIESIQIMYAIIPVEVKVMILFGMVYFIYDLCVKHFRGDE